MSKLKAIKPKKAEPKKPKILIYGKPGVGKTWAALDFPACYYIDTEGGANLDHYTDKLSRSGGVYFGPEQGSMDFETIIEQVKALGTEKHDYKTIVIDSVSKVFNMFITNEMERLGDKDQFGASKKKPVSAIKRLVAWLERVDMNVILIAHEKTEWGKDAKGDRVEIGQTFDAWDKLEYELDLCLNIVKAGPVRNALVRKTRLKQFQEDSHFSWSYDSFSQKYGKEIIEKKGETIMLATSEQIKKINNLLERVKLPEGQEEKWLSKANVQGWDEMSTERIDAAIKHIEETYLKTTEKEN
jgi:hypothetical protein